MNAHTIFLRVVADANGKRTGKCDPKDVAHNRVKVGQTVRFESADPTMKLDVGLSGVATFTPGSQGAFFREFSASGAGVFDFAANLTRPDGTVIEWEPGGGGQGQVQF